MSLMFIKTGLQTSIQDGGRFGQMHNGISRSGAMDTLSMQMANWLVSKTSSSALIEITLIGSSIQFTSAMAISVCGAQFVMHLNDKPIHNNETIIVKAGDKLIFGKLYSGARAYLAFSGEPELEFVLSSVSTHITAGFGGYQDRAFKVGDQLTITQINIPEARKIPANFVQHFSGRYVLRW